MEQPPGQTESDASAAVIAALKARAEQRDKLSQYDLGTIYSEGQFVPQDYSEALVSFHKAAQQGHEEAKSVLSGFLEMWTRKAHEHGDPTSQYYLGLVYEHGYGVPQDYGEVLKWYTKAAAKGNTNAQAKLLASREQWILLATAAKKALAQYLLAAEYAKGKGGPKDETEAARCYRRAALNGHAESQFIYGLKCHEGDGVKKDAVEAAKCYRMAAEQGHARAQKLLGDCYANGEGVEGSPAKALNWYRKAACGGCPIAYVDIGLICGRGYFDPGGSGKVQPNPDEALENYRKAAEYDDAEVQFRLGQIYHHEGGRIAHGWSTAIKFYKSAAAKGCFKSRLALGWMCFHAGKGANAMEWLRSIVGPGEGDASYAIAFCFLRFEKNITEAINYYIKAAKLGKPHAKTKLGLIYFEGGMEGASVEKDYVTAVAWSAGVRKLLGDIYASQSNLVEAYAWYNMQLPSRQRYTKDCIKLSWRMTAEEIVLAEKRTVELVALVESRLTKAPFSTLSESGPTTPLTAE